VSLVSIITAAFNAESYLTDTYDSIKKQTLVDWEWLVTDDCSTDHTLSILNRIAEQDSRVKVFQNEVNSGAAVSRNKSLHHANSTFIAFIDSDDLWLPDKLRKQIHFMEEGIDFSFTAYELVDAQGHQLNQQVDTGQHGAFSFADMLRKKATLGCSTVIIRRSAFAELTMPLIRTGQDYAFWLKLLKTGKSAHVLGEVCSQYRILPNSISRNKFKKAKRQWQIYREIENIAFIPSLINFGFYAWRAIFRK
jgi:glycosyltransferase involved in cell wall biosynthesis